IGNFLIILSVLYTPKLRTVTNCFILSLGVADFLVGVTVLPPAILITHYDGVWVLGWILCDVWISLDILLCTASILSLCAISIDRFLAISRPISYSKMRRSKTLAVKIISGVWLLSLLITCPPILGWSDSGRHGLDETECRYNENAGYVIYSSIGSFYAPMLVILYTYARIVHVVRTRNQEFKESMYGDALPMRCKSEVSSSQMVDFESTRDIQPSSPRVSAKNQCFEMSKTKSGANVKPCHIPSQPIKRPFRRSVLTDKDNLVEDPGLFSTSSPASLGVNWYFVDLSPQVSCHPHPAVLPCPTCGGPASTNGSIIHLSFVEEAAKSNTTAQGGQNWSRIKRSSPETTNGLTIDPMGNSLNGSPHLAHSKIRHKASNVSQNGLMTASSHRHIHIREARTAKRLAIVVGFFIMCWLPFFVLYVMAPFLSTETFPATAYELCTWLGWGNSALNPFLYAAYNPTFRSAFYNLTFGK
ncbi:hypothetical protein TCAL_13334, partial [Tigriopus californicus]